MTALAFDFSSPIAVNKTVEPCDVARLSKQCRKLLERLQRGPLTNMDAVTELRILNLTARVSEIRQAGYDVRATRVDGGLFSYSLVAP